MRQLLLAGSALVVLAAPGLTPAAAQGGPSNVRLPPVTTLDELVVTATRRPEPRSTLAGTVQVIDEATIRASTAQNLTDLLAENAVGFFSEWTPAQTSINIRGGSSDGQGRDFRSQVLVLVNGRRAGTANLSKLSPAEVARIEVIRGPASVVYGSQAIGGVINLILRDGLNSPGGQAEIRTGSWGLLEGRVGQGGVLPESGVDYYLGVAGGRRDSYRAGGGGEQGGTQWNRLGALGALGVQTGLGRVATTVRTDGTYDAGFRGSAWNTTNSEDRTNASADVTLDGATPDDRFRWFGQFYAVRDQDNLRWRSPIQRSAAGLPVPGTDSDRNNRTLDILGLRLQPSMRLWQGADLVTGLDLEHATLRSTRTRIGLPGSGITSQVPPFDNDQTEQTLGLFSELSQRLLDDRLTLRAGVRQSWGETQLDATDNQPLLRLRSASYDATTWSAGASLRVAEGAVLRANAATGFRAPTATDLAADFTALGGGRTFGNPDLKPETSVQYELGSALFRPGWRADLALFQNTISDRITTSPRPGVANTSDYVNNPGDIVVRGVELQWQGDVARALGITDWRWTTFANASWNFDMVDEGAQLSPTVNTRTAQRMYRYQAAFGTTVGQPRWDVTVTGILRGPMYYDTEENLLIPEAEPYRSFIHRKDPVWVWNLRGSFQPMPDAAPGLRVFGAINNIFDTNYHPIFIAIAGDSFQGDARFANGGRGNSAPGREFTAGLRVSF
ncbi:TonB-dependent receptor [Falsiroseomonas sp.]|uniref:TonB-dependent receptor n=1 Tax=Falsiroseomonas sp. TaxID=2870721 RepID=UPI0027175E82|nr:TonB-dependent receptor [Falsiroseomonas sp.]MDO9499363.1 TonB-dependent receptor [Falsiroseomonas sp.]